MSGSPAKAAGLREGDIITKVNGSEIGVVGSVATLVAEYSPGEIVELMVLRDGSEQAIKVEVGQYTD